MKALLIIDMQNISFTPETPRFDAEGVINRINDLSDNFRKNGYKIIFIQYDGTREGFCIPGTHEWEILSSLKREVTDIIVSKTANDSFYRTGLNDLLLQQGINELIITGCATDFCVDATVKAALVHDFQVTVIADGHTTADRPGLTSKQVIAHYNWIWSEMTPTKGKIEILDLEDYLQDAT